MANLHSTIFALCEERGERPSFSLQTEGGGYRQVTWSAYRDSALRFCAFLHSNGVRAGDRVALISENSPEWTMAALAVFNLGAELVPIASIASILEIENTLRGSKPKFCIYSQELSVARQVSAFLSGEKIPAIAWKTQGAEPLSEWTKDFEPYPVNDAIAGSSVALLIFTSGTTGAPKGVPISHENVLANARGVISLIEASADDRLVSVLPLSHMLEFTGGFVVASLVGASVTYIKSMKPEDLLKAMRDTRATIFIAVPLLFEVIARNLKAKLEALPRPVSGLLSTFSEWTRANPALGRLFFRPIHQALGGHIRFFVAGGSRLHPQTFDFFQGIGITILQGYGLTETAPVLAMTVMKNAGSDHVGKALPQVEIGIFNDQGHRLSVGQEGEIRARGPNVFRGYLGADHNQGVFSDGWFCTGDLGTLDDQGILRITGRKKDIIVTPAGKNVYPEELESLILATGLFLETAVLGMKDEAGHEKIVLVLVPNRAKFLGKANEQIVVEASEEAHKTSRTLADYKWPQKIEVMFDELPKTSTRKVKKHELRKLLEQRGARARAREGTDTGGASDALDMSRPVEAAIAQGISAITKMDPARIRLKDSLTKDIGLDSLTFVELVGDVEAKFQVKIEEVDFSTIQTVQDLVTILQFAAKETRGFSLFNKVFFTEFSPKENKKFLWRLPRRFFNSVIRSYLRFHHDLEVEGAGNLSGGGPFLFCPNHSSHFDLLSIAGSIPPGLVHRTFAVAAKDYFFNRTLKALGARIFVNAIPFDRKGRVNESMQRCREALDSGDSLVIFPEGTRSPTGRLQPFKQGVGQLLAGHPKAQAIPVFIDGAYQIMPKGSKLPGPGKLRIRFGKPISFAEFRAEPESMKLIVERLRNEVIDLGRGRL